MPEPTVGVVPARHRRRGAGIGVRFAGLVPSAFYRQVSYLTLATAASQAVSLVATVLLARMYAPHDFGQLSIMIAVATICSTAATLRLEMAVPLADTDDEAVAVATAALALAALVSVALLGFLLVTTAVRGRPMLDFGAGPSVWLVPPTVTALGALAAFRMLLGREQRFGTISRTRFTASLVQNVVQLTAGKFGAGALGLSVGFVSAQLWNTVALSRGTGVGRGMLAASRAAAVKWRRFSLLLLWPSLLNTATVSAVAPLVALFYGVAVSGLFTFSTRILTLPATLIGQAVATVLYPRMAEQERNGEDQAPAIQRAVTGLTMLSVPFFGLILLLGPDLFVIAFGAQWRAAGEISALLAPWLAVSFVSSPLSGLMTVKKQLHRLVVLAVVETTLRVGALSTGLLDDRPMTGIAAYSATGVVICLYYVRWSLRISGSSLRSWLWSIRRYALVTGLGYPALLWGAPHLGRPVHAVLCGAMTLLLLTWGARWLYRQGIAGPRGAAPSVVVPDAGVDPARTGVGAAR